MSLKSYEDVMWVEAAHAWMPVVGWVPGPDQGVALHCLLGLRHGADAALAAKLTAKALLRRVRQRRQIQGMIATSYLIDALVLLIYARAGTVPPTIGPDAGKDVTLYQLVEIEETHVNKEGPNSDGERVAGKVKATVYPLDKNFVREDAKT